MNSILINHEIQNVIERLTPVMPPLYPGDVLDIINLTSHHYIACLISRIIMSSNIRKEKELT